MKSEDKYTVEVYRRFQKAVDAIEKEFFTDRGLKPFPKIALALNNKCSRNVVAFVSPDYLYDTKDEDKVQYLAINTKYLGRSVSYILSTLCHELCHVYEVRYIHVPRCGYHTKAWCELMEGCGLEPVFNNKSRTSVCEKIKEGGVFDTFCRKFEEDNPDFFNLVEYSSKDHVSSEEDRADNADKPVKKYNRNKMKYVCPDCDSKVWGKSGLLIQCGVCNVLFEEEDDE